ncbi:MAG: protoporphyrinogen oxidase HemJ [Alphaproteobacteria bacterium]
MDYNFIKAFHIIFFTTWMAGLFYLPRIFVYHSNAKKNSSEYKVFVIMERKLLLYIMNPSMILTWILGLLLILNIQEYKTNWFTIKVLLVFLMSVFHIYCAKVRKDFEKNKNKKSHKFYRLINEIPTVLFFLIVLTVVFKPFN